MGAFLREEIAFGDITRLVEDALAQLGGLPANTLEDVFAADRAARIRVQEALRR